MDTLGDFLTIIRNASRARKQTCVAQWSKMREGLARILQQEGYVGSWRRTTDECGHQKLEVSLRYVNGTPVITDIQRHSRPGCRLYYRHNEIPRVLGGLGTSILTTSRGIMSHRNAFRQKAGGELICQVW